MLAVGRHRHARGRESRRPDRRRPRSAHVPRRGRCRRRACCGPCSAGASCTTRACSRCRCSERCSPGTSWGKGFVPLRIPTHRRDPECDCIVTQRRPRRAEPCWSARVTELGWPMAQAAARGRGQRADRPTSGSRGIARTALAGLEDRRSAPHRRPHRTRAAPGALDRRACAARRLSGPAIAQRTGHRRARRWATCCGAMASGTLPPLEPKPPVRRYERARPGELVHIDTKALGRIAQVGHRITGDRRDRCRGIGWEHVHVCIDDASARGLRRGLADAPAARCASAFSSAPARGLRRAASTSSAVMSDNGSAYRSRAFAATVRRLGLRHLRTRPYTPRTNGKAERFIQTLLREWAYRDAPTRPRRAAAGPSRPGCATTTSAARTPRSATARRSPGSRRSRREQPTGQQHLGRPRRRQASSRRVTWSARATAPIDVNISRAFAAARACVRPCPASPPPARRAARG